MTMMPEMLSILQIPTANLSAVERTLHEVAERSLRGRLGEIVREHLESGGKRLRARLALAAAAALDVEDDPAVEWATACELLHNATLIHDDLQDRDTLRRGRPTLWARHGDAHAINAGDAMLMLPYLALTPKTGTEALRWRLGACLTRRALATANGQAMELTPSKTLVSWADYVEMAQGKSGQLFSLPFEGAALLAQLSPAAAQALGDASVSLGVLYQILDDVLDLFPSTSDPDHARNERRGGDVREGKITALVALHVERRPEERAEIMSILDAPGETIGAEQLQSFCDRLVAAGTLSATCKRGFELVEALRVDPSLREWPRLHEIIMGFAAHLGRSLKNIQDDWR